MHAPRPAARPAWPDYRAIWRWHFYAGLFCIPFVLVLSLSGAVYLFKPQLEAWLERDFDRLQIQGPRASAAEQVRAALDAAPGSAPSGYELPRSATAAGRVIVRDGAGALRVYVHPQTLATLGAVREDDRLMRQIFRLHGELWLGDRGSHLVELAASWTIVMLLTGLVLWWPRQARGLAGVLYPRLRRGFLWRDLHAVGGVWISLLALTLLVTGLPWSKFWGSYFKAIRRVTGTAVAQQDWSTGGERRSNRGGERGGGEHGEHAAPGGARPSPAPLPDLAAFDRIAATVEPLGLQPPVVIAPPQRGSPYWTAKSMTQNRPWRVNLELDGATGEIVRRENFRDRHWVDQLVGIGIAAHEGQLFGWPNQLLGLATAGGLVLLCASGVVLWIRRREPGTLGAPKPLAAPRLSLGLVAMVLLLGLWLPLFGGSLVAVLAVEKLLLARIPRVREWLGIAPPAKSLASVPSAVLLAALLLAGCGARPVTGGTPGLLQAAGQPLSEVQLTLHAADGSGWKLVGFAVAGADGSFELVTEGAQGPLRLPPGDYRCTLESVGAPLLIPIAYAHPATSPLAVTWSDEQQRLELDVPAFPQRK